MNGVGGGLFEPNGETTRAMLVMVLFRMAGAPDMAGRESSFTDVSADSWYGAAVIWASENGIVNGIGGGLFDPDTSLTREQMAMMLYRFAGYLGSNTEKRADLERLRRCRCCQRICAGCHGMGRCRGPCQWPQRSGASAEGRCNARGAGDDPVPLCGAAERLKQITHKQRASAPGRPGALCMRHIEKSEKGLDKGGDSPYNRK